MRVKLLVVGIVYFKSILIKSDASNKCYLAKICIHDGNEKCGQDLAGNVRRFLDSCDMKEYNCLKKTNYLKTNPAKCKNIPVIDEKDITTDGDGNSNKTELNEDDDTENVSFESIANEVDGADSSPEEDKENENSSTSQTDDPDRISKEVGVKESDKRDQILEVDVVVVSEESTNNTKSKEYRAIAEVETDKDIKQESEKRSEEDSDDNVDEENKEGRISKEVGVQEGNKEDQVVDVDIVVVSADNELNTENKEDTLTVDVEADRDTEQETEGRSEEDGDDNVVGEETEEVERVYGSNEPREYDDSGQINRISVSDNANKVENEDNTDQDNNRNGEDDEEITDKLLAENVYDTDESDS